MNRIDWEPLREIIDRHQRFVISSHVRPDADAIGSELGLAGLLEALGKTVRIVNPSHAPPQLQFLDPENRLQKIGEDVSVDDACDTDVHIVVDTSAWAQLPQVAEVLKRTQAVKVVIDHHASSDDLRANEFKDVDAAATGELIVRLADGLGYPLIESIAVPLFCAIATDTGWFRFSATTGETLRTAGRLIDLGAQPHLIYKRLYETHSPARQKLAGLVLGRIETAAAGRIAWTWVNRDDFDRTGSRPSDTEDLVNECLRIAGVEAAFFVIEQTGGRVKVSFRSRTELDVAKVAEQFGGGGHRQAAGATFEATPSEAHRRVLETMTAALPAG